MKLSVVIPTWSERKTIGAAVESARAFADEVIVADAESPDGTAEAAARAGARIVRAPRGRGAQLHAGAKAALGDVLLFLHADTSLPPSAREAIEVALRDPKVVGGNFLLRFVPSSPAASLFGWANDVRRRLFAIYYGDSAIFVRRPVYDLLGGFRSLPLFEDYDLVRRLERGGKTAYIRSVRAETSARRFSGRPLRTLALWSGLQVLYSVFDVDPVRLARFYAAVR